MFTRFFRQTAFKKSNLQVRTLFNPKEPFSRENIPFYGAIVGITALSFQISVLYPWHHELSDQFTEIEILIKQLHTATNALDVKIDKVMALEEQVKAKERKILDREEEILKMEIEVLAKIDEIKKMQKSKSNLEH